MFNIEYIYLIMLAFILVLVICWCIALFRVIGIELNSIQLLGVHTGTNHQMVFLEGHAESTYTNKINI